MNSLLKMAAERYLSRRIPDLRVGNNIGQIDKKPISSRIRFIPVSPTFRNSYSCYSH